MATDTKNTPTLSAEIQRILSENSHLKYLSDTGKIKCSLSGHEMSCDAKVVNSYLHGKKHKRLKALNDYDYDKYRQHLVDSTKRFPKNQLLCLLTYKYINNSQSALQKHINGRKFQRAFKKWEEFQKEGKEYIVPNKQKPNSSENFEDNGKKRKKKSKYEEEDEEDESDNDSLSDLYPWEEFQKEGKKCAVSKKQKANCSENIGKKKKKRKYEEEDEEEESDNESLSDLCPREEFQKESKEYVVSKKQKPNCSENCKDIGKKRKKKSKYEEEDEEEESDNDSLSDLYPTEEFQKNDDDHKSVKKTKYASESKFKKKKKKKKKNKVAVTV